MTKTPEELTEDWKKGKLNDGEKYFIRYKNSIFIATFRYFKARINYWRFIDKGIECCDDSEEDLIEVLAPVPTYDEYKAMQEELTEFKRSVTSYIGKPINYDIACETVNKLLDDKEQLKKELESARWYQTIQNEDIGKLRGLLKECLAHLSIGEIGTSVIPINILIDRINAALGESEE